MIVAPCQDCVNRQLGCHATCESYLAYNDQQEDLRKKKMQKYENDKYFVEAAAKHAKRKSKR